MAQSLGILVCSDRHFDHVFGVCGAARGKGIRVKLFLTHLGLRLTRHPRFEDLTASVDITLCRDGLKSQDIQADTLPLDGEAHATQASNAELIHSCDRYLVF